MYFPFVTSNVEYENIATLCVFSSHGDNTWETLVRHECLTTIVLSIPEVIVQHQTSVHPTCSFKSFWRDCTGRICWCMEGRMSRWFIVGVRSHAVPPLRQVMQYSYLIFSSLTMKTRLYKLQRHISYAACISLMMRTYGV
jgi:hypothetical protein